MPSVTVNVPSRLATSMVLPSVLTSNRAVSLCRSTEIGPACADIPLDVRTLAVPFRIAEGDFFRAMRYVQMPGIDTIGNQIWPDKISDFPKYASSAAHIFGRPRAFTESFAGYNPAPTLDQARWVLNQQLVRGINMVE